MNLMLKKENFFFFSYNSHKGHFLRHHQYIGTPKVSFFHKFVSRGAYVLIASDRNVLASINVRSGNIGLYHVKSKRVFLCKKNLAVNYNNY